LAKEFGGVVVDPVTPDRPGTPVSFEGFKVLFTEETGERDPWFYDLTASPQLAAYFDAHGGPQVWRVWDDNLPTENASPEFQELAKLAGTTPYTVVAANNKRAAILALKQETTVTEVIQFLQQFGGK